MECLAADFALLGLTQDAHLLHVKIAYHLQALLVHPDKGGGGNALFMELTEDFCIPKGYAKNPLGSCKTGEACQTTIINKQGKNQWTLLEPSQMQGSPRTPGSHSPA